ncbi:hypothetical protein BAUCODRAFT_78043 [Baudoinia panamericana UAMH 10762]|uniref:3',5'-cyclic-nucleotide phosphodiesterase n=1 Tax=Baudoinia panamericana (strain UAMH 10762) TaxID=717646 RepID=M2M7E9_BAUPA|nr:uncharacterized protein BAUCODRAFT_78043 [Baudoinia panamericana UAMH 10762]EMC92241.1 hypothetical protein BAUCODRAFT_78043 [Baudoinia panamericana UAMH 10762]
MKTRGQDSTVSDTGQKPAIQVICLGASGGPSEESVTAFLVRSVHSGWARGSLLALDAGSHLAPITRILERDFPTVSDGKRIDGPEPTVLTSGPFSGLELPHASARANALHVLRAYISAYLITHPHLDHISGFAINTAAFHATSKPKTLAALPMTVDAIKQHIFNDVIWPNLTDEDGGVGFVTFQRLKEGGDVMVGDGEGRGYIDVVDGLGIRAFKISHGVSTKVAPTHHHRGSISGFPDIPVINETTQFMARTSQPSPRLSATAMDIPCVVDSTAFFIRDDHTALEVLMFGDLEPDSISLYPRNRIVWEEAARKIALGLLRGIFIECSYEDAQGDAILFGHLCPRHLISELQSLAALVAEARATRAMEKSLRKRKRSVANGPDSAKHTVSVHNRKRSRSLAGRSVAKDIRRSSAPGHAASHVTTSPPLGQTLPAAAGLKVVVMHIKDTMKDGPYVGETILAQLQQHEAQLDESGTALGCEFVVAKSGESYWL